MAAAPKIEMIAPKDLKPYERNARTHPPSQKQQIMASMQEFGFRNPILIDKDGEVIAGHGRLDAAIEMGTAKVPCIRCDGLSEEQVRAYRLADNRIALNAGWDRNLLELEVRDLAELETDLSLLGFSETDLQEFLAQSDSLATNSEDEIPTPERESCITSTGDVWILGGHRLICADATDRNAVATVLDNREFDLCFTSPPYDHQRDYDTGIGDWQQLMEGVFTQGMSAKHDAQILVNLGLVHRDGEWLPYWEKWIGAMRRAGWKRFGLYVWDQGAGLPGDWNGRLAPSFEFIFHFCNATRKATKTKRSTHAGQLSNGGLREKDGSISGRHRGASAIHDYKLPDSVIRITRQKGRVSKEVAHPATFPVALPREIIIAYSNQGDLCFEPFSGVGTTLIACETTKRYCAAVEISPAYVDMAVRRWQAFTGDQAVREGDGAKFDDCALRAA